MKSPVAMARSNGPLKTWRDVARPFFSPPEASLAVRPRTAFTLVEVLIATALTLLLMAGIVTLFASVSESISRGQAMMETVDRLRGAQHRLQTDLKFATAPMLPTLDPRNGPGYFEIIEGPGPYDDNAAAFRTVTGIKPIKTEYGTSLDTTVGDTDDILMFTARSYGEPFVGKFTLFDNSGNPVVTPIQSQVAEICWFMRGTTLYRRVLLVVPERTIPAGAYNGMYYHADVSVHQEGGPADSNAGWGNTTGEIRLVANSLGDLTKRENRYGHWPRYAGPATEGYPHDARFWGQLGLPTLRESSGLDKNGKPWPFPFFGNAPVNPAQGMTAATDNDFWLTPHPAAWGIVDPESGSIAAYINNPSRPERMAEDVILNNVLSFDVKVWDPWAPVLRDTSTGQVLEPGDPGYRIALQSIAPTIISWVNAGRPAGNMPSQGTLQVARVGAYVDLYYTRGLDLTTAISNFSNQGNRRSQLHAPHPDNNNSPALAAAYAPAVWDPFSIHYESDGVNQDAVFGDNIVDNANDGLDNNGMGGVDDASERDGAPYEAPIRSIQIKIRVYERDTRQIREVTVTQDFVP